MNKEIQDYSQNANSIKTLSERNKIRDKIGMYAGTASKEALITLLREVSDNSIDEFNYHKENIEDSKFETIKIKVDTKNLFASVRDYGRGIPYVKDKNGMSTLEKTLTILHAGGKHSNNSNYLLQKNINKNNSNYSFSAGINGIGICLDVYASQYFKVVVYNEKKQEKSYMTFKNGYIDQPATIIPLKENLDFLSEEENKDLQTGTYIIFSPSVKNDEFDDENIFEPNSNFEKEDIINQLKILPYLNPGLRIELEYDNETIIFKKQDTFDVILNKENKSQLVFKENPYFQEYMVLGQNRETKSKKVFSLDDFIKLPYTERIKYKIKTSIFELAFNFLEENKEPFQENTVNGSIRIHGGKQDQVWKNQIKKIINNYINENKSLQRRIGVLDGEDIYSSLTFMFMVKINEPSFAGQTKEKLNNPELVQFGNYFFKKYLKYWINRADKKEIEKLLKILEANKKARLKSDQIKDSVFKDITNSSDNALLMNSTKLTKCKSKDPKFCELFLVEGDSAGGSCKQSRVIEYQAILPLKGKLLNSLKTKDVKKIFNNQEIINLITALECKIGKDFNYSKLRYNKIIIFSDKDTDGLHIRNLNEVFFYRFYKDLIKKGHIYIVDAPLFAIKTSKKTYYAWTIKERDEITKKVQGRYEVTRFKGLGEMNPEQLYETCLNKKNRKLIQTTLEDFSDLEEIKKEDNEENLEDNETINENEELEKLIHVYMNDRKEDKQKREELITEYYTQPRKTLINLEMPEK